MAFAAADTFHMTRAVSLAVSHIDWVEVSAVATAALALATFAFVVVAYLQRRDTADAAAAATRAAMASEKSLQHQREAWDMQLRLTTYPALACEFEREQNHASLVLSNGTDLPAFDIDLAILSLYPADEDENAAEKFAAAFVEVDRRDKVRVSDEGFIPVLDHITYATVASRRTVAAPINAPEVPPFLVVLLQFRDILGRNYCRLYSAGQSNDPGSRRYSFAMWPIPEETILQDYDRIEVWTVGDPDLPSEPEVFWREFGKVFEFAIPAGCLMTPRLEIEERGSWRST